MYLNNMVRPKSRKSGSGQSSILKASLRQSLQHVSSNGSLNQESPVTSKLKRRVSFAEKNHVKEFADSVEQGTLWNNTYEESSNKNAGQIDLNNQNHEIVINNNHSTGSGMIVSENTNLMNDSLELTECLVTMGSLKPICTEETPLNQSISLAHQSKNNDDKNNISIKSNHDKNICAYKNINVYNNISSLNNVEGSHLNKTCTQDISMEVTEIHSFMKSQNILPIKCKQVSEEKENIPTSATTIESNVSSISTDEMNTMPNKTKYFCTETLEFTECLQFTKEPLDLQQKSSKISALTNDENVTNHQTQIFQNASMEMTCTIPLTYRKNSTDQTIIFHDASMDDTKIVTSVMNKKEKPMNKNISQVENDNRFLKKMITSTNKTKLLDASMDITEGIYSLPHSTRLNDVTDTMNTLNYRSSVINGKTELKNDSMEFTVPVANSLPIVHNINREKLPQVTKINACIMSNQTRLSSESTKIFQNESMAITEPLNVLSPPHILQNDTQELKGVIMNYPKNNQSMSPNTKIFQNMSMEITNAIANLPILPNLEKSSKNIENDYLNLDTNKKQIDVIEHGPSQENSIDITTPVYSNPNSSTILSNKIVDTTIKNNSTFKHTNENRDTIKTNSITYINENRSLLQNKNSNSINQILNTNEKLEKHDCILDSMYQKTRKNHSMSEAVQKTDIQFNSSNNNINKSTHQAVDDTYFSCTTYRNDDIENTENISTNDQPVKALTSLISSFVYADMIEDDSFVKTIHEVQQEIHSRENDMNVNSIVNIADVQATNIQSSEKCIIENEQVVQQTENYFKYYREDNNIEVDDIISNKEVNNQHNSDIVSNKINEIHENVFENSINNERLIDFSEVEVIQSGKQLHKTKKNFENNSATYIIKSKKNSDIDVNEHINDHSSNNQILCKSHVLSPTLISAYNKNKTYTDENNIMLTADVTDLTCSMDVTQNDDNNSSREEVNHIVLEENIGKNNYFQEDNFSLIVRKLKNHMQSNDCIWDLYFENIDKQMLVVSFISTSLLIIIYTQNSVDTNTHMIKDINIISRLENDENMLLSIAHKLISEKINIEHICQLYKYEEDIIPLLNHISEDVKLILDFIFDLKQLDDTNLMEINTERITFISRSKCMDIILKITMKIELFDKINSSNIKVVCILGTVIEKDIKELFTNVKRDHKFLRRYMSDIKDYIDIMEQVNAANKKSRCIEKEKKINLL